MALSIRWKRDIERFTNDDFVTLFLDTDHVEEVYFVVKAPTETYYYGSLTVFKVSYPPTTNGPYPAVPPQVKNIAGIGYHPHMFERGNSTRDICLSILKSEDKSLGWVPLMNLNSIATQMGSFLDPNAWEYPPTADGKRLAEYESNKFLNRIIIDGERILPAGIVRHKDGASIQEVAYACFAESLGWRLKLKDKKHAFYSPPKELYLNTLINAKDPTTIKTITELFLNQPDLFRTMIEQTKTHEVANLVIYIIERQ